jgi:hypothetical protein
MVRKLLIFCGILSSLYYVAINTLVPGLFEGYDINSQTVSELSAIDAPTRSLWVPLAFFYVLLFGAFGLGVWFSSGPSRHLRTMAWMIAAYTILNFYWPPMHLRGNTTTLTDTMHIIWAMVTILLMMLIMGFGAAAFGTAFRFYTITCFVVFLIFGLLTARDAPGIQKGLPTPWIGIWERINIGVFMVWIIVFSVAILRKSPFVDQATNRQNVDAILSTENRSL